VRNDGFPLTTLLIAVAAMVVSCVPVFQNPLPGPDREPRLFGEWVSTNETGDISHVYFFPRQTRWLDVVAVGHVNSPAETNGVSVQVFEGYAARLDDLLFLCLRKRPAERNTAQEETSDTGDFMILSADLSREGWMAITPFSNEKLQEMIESGRLEGRVEKGRFVTSVRVSAPGEVLADAIREKGLAAFLNTNATILLKRCPAQAE